MKYKWAAILLLTSLIAQQCARQTAPTGGPQDETAPILLRSLPTHEQTQVSKNELELIFDEFVQLNNPRDQIIITPSVGNKFETIAKKNKVIVKLNSALAPNTTYSINFRESIQDLTEKNPATVKIAFSTGTYIDSLAITGRVVDILTNKDASNYTVALVPASDTFNIFKHSASWITLTNKQGRFSLENLKQGNYFLYAFDDRNKNLIVDSKSEKYAFRSDTLALTSNQDSIRLYSYKLDGSTLKLVSSRPTFSYFNIKLSKSITDYSLTEEKDSIPLYSMLDSDLSSIKIFNSIGVFDSLQVRFQSTDSIESKIDTLLYLKFSQKKDITKDKLSTKTEICNVYEDNSLFTAILSFSKPMTYFNPDSIYIQVDSLTRTNFTKENFSWNNSQTKLTISKRLEVKSKELNSEEKQAKPIDSKVKAKSLDKKGLPLDDIKSLNNLTSEPKTPKSINQLILAKGSILSVENDSIAKQAISIKSIKPQDTGIIITKVGASENFILQLLSKNLQVVDEVKNIKEHRFTNLTPGGYEIRLLMDLNKNGKWDPGDYVKMIEPEPIVFYKNSKNLKEINLKANWEVGPLLITY